MNVALSKKTRASATSGEFRQAMSQAFTPMQSDRPMTRSRTSSMDSTSSAEAAAEAAKRKAVEKKKDKD